MIGGVEHFSSPSAEYITFGDEDGMAKLGKLHEFQPDVEELSTYLKQVEIYFAANDVPDGKKVPALLSAIGGNMYCALRSLLAPKSPMSKS